MDIEACELLFATKSRAEILKKKTTEKQIRAFSGGNDGDVKMTVTELKKLCKARNNFEYLSGYENRVRQYTISDEAVDRYGDVVRAKGVDFTNYRKNPVIQYAHDYEKLPIGISIKEGVDKATNTVRSTALFFDDRVDTSGRSDLIYRFISSNGMRACSVGFTPTTYEDPTDAERKKMGMGKYGVLYTGWDLLEFSPVPVPANPNALTDSMRKSFNDGLRKSLRSGLFKSKDVQVLREYPLFEMSILDAFIDELGNDTILVGSAIPKIIIPDGEPIAKDAATKQNTGEHVCRLNGPTDFTEFKRSSDESDGKTYSIVWGKKDDEKWEVHAYRYAKEVWTEDKAKKHCSGHEGGMFEAARNGKAVEHEKVPLSTIQNITLSLDIAGLQKEIGEIAQEVKNISSTLDETKASFEEKTSDFISTAQRALSAIETRKKSTSLYDERTEIASLLKLKK